MTHNGGTTSFEVEEAAEPHSWVLKGPGVHRYGTVSFAVARPKRRMTTRPGIQVNLRRQRFTFEVDGTPATLVMSDGEATSAP